MITFWKKPRYPSFISSLQSNITCLLRVFGSKIIISKWGKKLFQSVAALTTFYFKVGQRQLLQSGLIFISTWAIISKWGKSYFKVEQLLQSGARCYFKVGELFQSGAEQRQPKSKFLASCESLTSVQFKSCNRPSNLKYLKVDDVLK